MDLFFRLFDSAGYGSSGRIRRKLWALFIVSLMPPTQSIFSQYILKEIDQVVNICVDVLTENKEGESVNPLAPHAISYDSEEETIDVDSSYYDALLKSDFMKVGTL